MNPLGRWREDRERQQDARWEREHRWDRLGRYNAEVGRGLVHTPEYDAAMAEEQARFDAEQGYRSPFPITLDPA